MGRSARIPVPLAPVVSGMLAGLAAALLLPAPAMAAWALGPLLLAGALLRPLRVIAWSLTLGLLLGVSEQRGADLPPALALPGVYRVDGFVDQVELPVYGRQRFRLRGARTGHAVRLPDIDATLRLRGWQEGLPALLEPGMHVRLELWLARPRTRYEAARGALRGFVHDRRAIEVLDDTPGPAAALAGLRHDAAQALGRRLDSDDEGLARALLLGDRSHLDRADRSRFRRTGQAHLLAVSGLHVGLLLAGLLLLVARLGASRRATLITGLAAIAFYVPFIGAPPSAIRAGLAAGLWMLARLFGRAPAGIAVLTLVGTTIVFYEPGSALRPAFQLSFAAVLSILLLTERIRHALVRPRPVLPGLLPPVRAPIRTVFSVGLAAWLGTAPFVALHIGRLCPAGPVLALPALPLTACLLGSGFATLLLGPLPHAAALAAFLFSLVADALRVWLDLAILLHLGALPALKPPALWWAAYAVAFRIAILDSRRHTRLGLGLMFVLLGLLLVPDPSATRGGHSAGPSPAPGGYDPACPPMSYFLASGQAPEATCLALALVGAGLLVFAVLAVKPLAWLQPGGAAAAWVLGMAATYAFGPLALAPLFAPFVVATLVGRLPGVKSPGARTWRQVVSNGAPACVGCVIAVAGCSEAGLVFFLGSLACLGADTCATEIGLRYGGTPFRLAGRGPILAGESGGVTRLGLGASVVGAALAPATVALILGGAYWGAMVLLTTAGTLGALVDSVLGGTLQYRGRDPETGRVGEKRLVNGRSTETVSGWRWLDNDAVNLVSGLLAGCIAVGLVGLFF